MIAARLVRTIGSQPWFGATWSPCALLDEDLRIRAASPAFSRVTGYDEDRLVGQIADEVFPSNPDDPDASALDTLIGSIERTMSSGETVWLGLHRHDLPHPEQGTTTYVFKVWMPVMMPVTERGKVVGVVHHVQDVSRLFGSPGADVALAPQHGFEMELAVRTLARQFPDVARESVLTVWTDSWSVVLGVLGRPDTVKAIELARLRLEVTTGHPALPVWPGG